MDLTPRYAPQYSKAERQKRILHALLLAAPLIISIEYLLLPWLRSAIQAAPCYQWQNWSGLELLWYGLFVGLPASIGLIQLLLSLPQALASFRQRQYPPAGVKTFRPVQIRQGVVAQWLALRAGLIPALCGLLAVWGGFQAANMPVASVLPPHCPLSGATLPVRQISAEVLKPSCSARANSEFRIAGDSCG